MNSTRCLESCVKQSAPFLSDPLNAPPAETLSCPDSGCLRHAGSETLGTAYRRVADGPPHYRGADAMLLRHRAGGRVCRSSHAGDAPCAGRRGRACRHLCPRLPAMGLAGESHRQLDRLRRAYSAALCRAVQSIDQPGLGFGQLCHRPASSACSEARGFRGCPSRKRPAAADARRGGSRPDPHFRGGSAWPHVERLSDSLSHRDRDHCRLHSGRTRTRRGDFLLPRLRSRAEQLCPFLLRVCAGSGPVWPAPGRHSGALRPARDSRHQPLAHDAITVAAVYDPAPIDPPKKLVVRGLYRYARNPMYIGVLSVLTAEAILGRSPGIAIYAVFVWINFQLFVLLYEEPTLRSKFGSEYEEYCRAVPRWGVRLRSK